MGDGRGSPASTAPVVLHGQEKGGQGGGSCAGGHGRRVGALASRTRQLARRPAPGDTASAKGENGRCRRQCEGRDDRWGQVGSERVRGLGLGQLLSWVGLAQGLSPFLIFSVIQLLPFNFFLHTFLFGKNLFGHNTLIFLEYF